MAKPPPPASSPFWTLFNAFGRLQVRLLHLTRGRFGGKLMGVPVLVLHNRGRRSGQARETPLMYLEDGADVVVVGSKGGTDTHPAWFHNLMAMSETEVEVGGVRRRVRPRLANAEERARLWPRLVELYPRTRSTKLHEPGDPGRRAQARRLAPGRVDGPLSDSRAHSEDQSRRFPAKGRGSPSLMNPVAPRVARLLCMESSSAVR